MRQRERTPFPFPDDADPPPRWPSAPPLDATVASMAGWWLSVRCNCGLGRSVYLPFRLLAARLGWDVTLGHVLEHLRCSQCGGPPALVELAESAQGGSGRHGARDGRELVLIDRRQA